LGFVSAAFPNCNRTGVHDQKKKAHQQWPTVTKPIFFLLETYKVLLTFPTIDSKYGPLLLGE
jgi:hypothetical protein